MTPRFFLQSGRARNRTAHHSTMPPFVRKTCTARAWMSRSILRWTCGPPAVDPASRRPSDMHRPRRQCAAPAALTLPLRQRCAHGARLALGRSRERMRKAETEGKTKGDSTRPSAKPVCTWDWCGTPLLVRCAVQAADPASPRAHPRASYAGRRRSFLRTRP